MAAVVSLWVLCTTLDARADDASYRLSAPLLLEASLPIAQVDSGVDYASRPSTGTGLIVSGWIALGVGAVNLVGLAACYADFYPSDVEDACVIASIIVAGVAIPLGVTFLIIGYNQRSDYEKWRRNNGFARHLDRFQLSLGHESAVLSYTAPL